MILTHHQETSLEIKSLEADAKKSDSDSLEYHWDDQAKAPYIYDAAAKEEFWTYDNKSQSQIRLTGP